MEYYSVISSNNVGSRVEAWMDLEPVTQSDASQEEEHKWSVLSLGHQAVSSSVTPWAAAHQASSSFTVSQNLLKLMSTECAMPSNHLVLCRPLSSCPQSFPESGYFSMSQLFASGVSASQSVLPMNIQNWLPLGWTGWISLQSKGLSRVFGVLKNVFWCVISPKSSQC